MSLRVPTLRDEAIQHVRLLRSLRSLAMTITHDNATKGSEKMLKYIGRLITGSLSLVKGLLVTLRNAARRAVTIQYPTQKLDMTERFRGLVDLRREKCIICCQCVKICPTACLAITDRQSPENKKALETFKYNMELCCFCGLCEQVCPTQAIYMNKIYEIAVYKRDKLHIDLLNQEKYGEWANPTVK
jgi:NADH-quinone oxidoreductase subunit I